MLGLFLNPSGRIGRGMWWLTGALQGALLLIWAFSIVFKAKNSVALPIPIGLLVLIGIPLLWMGICANIKRYHDRGKSGFWLFISFVPIIGPTWLFIELGMLPGDSDANAYGPPPSSGGRSIEKSDRASEAKLAKFDDEYFRNYATANANRVVANLNRPAAGNRMPTAGTGKPVFGKRT
jgi:uncharacterized membrane protein YhaH (DUF805 family)